MCLETVDRITEQVTEGWKLFRVIDDKLYGSYSNIEFKTNEWIEDTENKMLTARYNMEKYKTGFHFYIDKDSAELEVNIASRLYKRQYKIFHVRVKNVTTTGLQYGYRVGVTRKIFIEEESCVCTL